MDRLRPIDPLIVLIFPLDNKVLKFIMINYFIYNFIRVFKYT